MRLKLDPTCPEAQLLERQHREQTTILVGPTEGQLASIVRQRQERQLLLHASRCRRCQKYEAQCPHCGFRAHRERHGWMCQDQPSRWLDLLPWNWRARYSDGWSPGGAPAAPDPAPAATGTPPPRPQPHQTAKVTPPAARPAQSPLALAYAALGVAATASKDDVRRAYRGRAQQYHPDKVAQMAPEFRDLAEKRMKELNAAYDRIKRSW